MSINSHEGPRDFTDVSMISRSSEGAISMLTAIQAQHVSQQVELFGLERVLDQDSDPASIETIHGVMNMIEAGCSDPHVGAYYRDSNGSTGTITRAFETGQDGVRAPYHTLPTLFSKPDESPGVSHVLDSTALCGFLRWDTVRTENGVVTKDLIITRDLRPLLRITDTPVNGGKARSSSLVATETELQATSVEMTRLIASTTGYNNNH